MLSFDARGQAMGACGYANGKQAGSVGLVFLALMAGSAVSATAGTSTVYQTSQARVCLNSINCLLHFPIVPASSRLEVQMIGCDASMVDQSGGRAFGSFQQARLFMQTVSNNETVRMPIRANNVAWNDATQVIAAASQVVAFSVVAGQRLQVNLYPPDGYFAKNFNCTISGQMVTLP